MFGFGKQTLEFKKLNFTQEGVFKVDGLTFNMTLSDYQRVTDEREIVLLKHKLMLDAYREMFGGTQVRNILEFGTWEGGSPLYFAAASNVEKFVGIDLRDMSSAIAGHASKYPDRLRLYYNTSQSDAAAVNAILDREFDRPIDLVIDDASHMYEHTKKAFEIAFPRLRVGGTYIIEDWNWAHYEDRHVDDQFSDQPALSNLALELVLAAGSYSAIKSVEVCNWHVKVIKGAEVPPDFRLDDIIRMGERRKYTHY
ncbi:MAG: hypothetical protein RIR62_2119 [Pseudomonadota bacterium]|jgi:cephalosporin hydroxylase